MKRKEKGLSLKLLIDMKSQKVIFAEAQKDLVDFLFSLLAPLSVGSVIRLMKHHSMAGSTGNLYESIECYVQPGLDKNMLLKPKSPYLPFGQGPPPLLLKEHETPKFYTCSGGHGYNYYEHGYVADVRGVACPKCKNAMTTEKTYAANNAVGSSLVVDGGFVKGLVTYTVTDDLVVKPMSTISSIALFSKLFKGKDVGDLEERVVQVGMNEGLAILKASFKSNTVLTDTFIGNEGLQESNDPFNLKKLKRSSLR